MIKIETHPQTPLTLAPRRPFSPRRLIVAILLTALALACDTTSKPTAGSQTHFLQLCDDSCGGGFECICGVCTLTCAEDNLCQEHGGSCLPPPSAECTATENVCDKSCNTAADCNSLGEDYQCLDGRCRASSSTISAEPTSNNDGGGSSDTEPVEGEPTANGPNQNDASTNPSGAGTSPAGTEDASAGSGATLPAADGGPTSNSTADASLSEDGGGSLVSPDGSSWSPSGNDAGPICDGSQDLRFAVALRGGFRDALYYNHTNPFGENYLHIYGSCEYWLSSNYMMGTYTGTLSEEQAKEIATQLLWHELETEPSEADCDLADAPAYTFNNGDVRRWCTCCDGEPWAGAVANYRQVLQTLEQQGTALDGPLDVIAVETSSQREDDLLDWPLQWSLDTIATTLDELNASNGNLTSTAIEDPADADAVRSLRVESTTNFGTQALHARGVGISYFVYPVDRLPQDRAAEFEAFWAP